MSTIECLLARADGCSDVAHAGVASERPGEAYAEQARYFTETRVLNREIRVILKGADKFNNLFGQIKYTDNEEAIDLGFELVTSGCARVSGSLA